MKPTAYITYKGCLLHADDPKVLEHSSPEPLYSSEKIKELERQLEEAHAALDNLGVTPEEAKAGLMRFREREARIAKLEQQQDGLLKLILSFGHKSGCRMNAFGDRCTCGIDAAIAHAKES